jgi:hypothetical protein
MTYLTIPPAVLERGILLVNSLPTLQEAAVEFGLTLTSPPPSGTTSRATSAMRNTPSDSINRFDTASASSGIDPVTSLMPPIRLWVGLDAEWKATSGRWQGDPEAECKHPSGAAILQVQYGAVQCSAVQCSAV